MLLGLHTAVTNACWTERHSGHMNKTSQKTNKSYRRSGTRSLEGIRETNKDPREFVCLPQVAELHVELSEILRITISAVLVEAEG